MLTPMREEYDVSHDTATAVELGLARTGKLVTSAALVLMFAFIVLSSSPGVDIKQFGIGLAAGIIFDATVIRTLLVPSLVTLFGRWNWWLPQPIARVLRVPLKLHCPNRACPGAWHQIGVRTRPALRAVSSSLQRLWHFGRVSMPGTGARLLWTVKASGRRP
jgi:RND superfamily putative drug exporter